MRFLVFAVLDLPGELRHGDDGDAQLLGQGLEALGDLGHLLHAIIDASGVVGGHQLQIVHDQKIQPGGPLEPSRAGGKLGHRYGPGGVDVEWGLGDLGGGVADPAEFGDRDVALADLVRRHVGDLGEKTHRQLLG